MPQISQFLDFISWIMLRTKESMSAVVVALVFSILATSLVSAQTFTTLYSFGFGPDGANPQSRLVRDAKGNLYGTTVSGGSAKSCPAGCGTVFRLDPSGTETVLHSFRGGTDGANPYAGLIRDTKGNLYGTTLAGGKHSAGTVFKLDPQGKETVLYSFTGGADGGFPYASLILDHAGNLYGTTYWGGSCGNYYGCGTVFKVAPSGKETVLYSFTAANDGAFPYAGLIRDAKGNFYGTTFGGGDGHCQPTGCGTVFKLDTTGKESVLHFFTPNNADGFRPYGSLIRDKLGNLYGTTFFGGPGGLGTVFRLDPSGTETIIYGFTGGADGGLPYAGVIMDAAGNLFGSTEQGGTLFSGTVFKVDTTGTESVLYSFTFGSDGGDPFGGLIQDSAGSLYGTASSGGDKSNGVVFKIAP